MNPLEQIKEGILEDDMGKVSLGYLALTGEELVKTPQSKQINPPDPPTQHDEHFVDSSGLSGLEDFIAPSKKEDAGSSAGRIARSTPIPLEQRENQFVDDGAEYKDIVTPDTELTPRQRSTFKMVSQKCIKCDKTFKVHPVHKRESYICDRCIVQ